MSLSCPVFLMYLYRATPREREKMKVRICCCMYESSIFQLFTLVSSAFSSLRFSHAIKVKDKARTGPGAGPGAGRAGGTDIHIFMHTRRK